MIITKESHLDHGLTAEHLKLLFDRFGDRNEFFIETIVVESPLPLIPSALYGPLVGDPKIAASQVEWKRRGDREYDSRIILRARKRLQDKLTVICGPNDGHDCILYTAFGGPLTPKEFNDPTLIGNQEAESSAFWAEHALVYP